MNIDGLGCANEGVWIFGYGSLIWRPGFVFDEKRLARVAGYERRFCQASHDHRGTSECPGRVVTLIPVAGSFCEGMAFKLTDDIERVLQELEIREQDGYSRVVMPLTFGDEETATCLTWVASDENPSWRGGEDPDVVAKIIASASGPSGSNQDYLFELERMLKQLSISDPHIEDLARAVRSRSEI